MTHPFDLDAFVDDHSRPLQLVHRVISVSWLPDGVLLRCETTAVQREYRDRYGTLVEVASVVGAGLPVTIAVTFAAAHTMRFRMAVGEHDAIPTNHTPMLADNYAPAKVAFDLAEMDEKTTLKTDELTITLEHDPWRMTVHDAGGYRLFDTVPAEVFQHPPTGMSGIGIDGVSLMDAWPWFFRGLYPLGFVQDEATGLTQTFETNRMHHTEHLYGFGEKFSDLDKRGQMINLWHENATGNTRPNSYKNVPFFMSSRGYGMFINSPYPIRYHLGDRHHTHYSLHLQHYLLDYFLVAGETYKDVLPRYTDLTGKPTLPPLWSFGLWMSRMSYDNQSQVEDVAVGLRARDIPCDVIHIDTDWFASPWVNDLTFSKERFPDPAAMVAKLREDGLRVTLWQIPYIAPESTFYNEGVENGYFAKDQDGSIRHIQGFFGEAAVMDYSNPTAVAWMQSKLEPLFDMGIAAIKTDFGEGAPPDAVYAEVDGLAMHNLYPLLYNRAVFEITQRKTGENIVWGRSAYAGCQRYPLNWGGDPAVLWGDLAQLWTGGLGLGLCGFPFWSVDIGGFGGTPTPDLYIRWAQAGLFVSHPRAHGPIAREPWAFGGEAERIFREYAKLRYRLIPYVWSTAHASVATGLPVMRPMMLDWQGDPTTVDIGDQFMFGEALLVAPILDESDRRMIYLPMGHWYGYWTDEVVDGPCWVERTAALDELPLYVRGGAIIPTAADAPHTGALDWGRITLDVYPDGGESSFALHDTEGSTPLRLEQTGDAVVLRLGAGERSYIVRMHGAPRPAVVIVNGSPLNADAWTVDKRGIVVFEIDGKPGEEVMARLQYND